MQSGDGKSGRWEVGDQKDETVNLRVKEVGVLLEVEPPIER